MIQLKENRFYKLIDKNDNWYFKFKCLGDDNQLKADGYYLNNDFEYKITTSSYICKLDDYRYEEIDIKDIIDFLPKDNPDKINFLRKQRIKSLLCL